MTAELSTSGDNFSVNGGKITDVADGVDPTDAANVSQITGGGGAPTTADYLVGTTQAGLSAEIVVGTTPGGELGGTWASPTVDATHSGSTHAAVQAAAEATAASALTAHTGDTSDAHDASAISADSTTLVGTGTDVQAVLEELDNGVADHLADTSAAHAASAISVNSATLVGAGTDVQAVFEEMDNDIATLTAASGIPATLFDAQGDIIVASAADTAARLAIGAANTVPKSNGTTLAYALPPGHEFDYAERTTDLTITATSAATAQVVVSGNAVTYDGSTIILIELFAAVLTCDTDLAATVNLWDGGTDLNRMWQVQAVVSGATTGTIQAGVHASRRLTPSAGAHTYHFKAWKGGGTAVLGAVAGTYLPAFIRITKV